jgi:ABC-type uncharacterized transport system substrate-binding protein
MRTGNAVKRLWLGVALIALAASVLLFSDWRQRAGGGRSLPRVAMFQHASQPALDEGVRGMLDALAEAGFRDGETMALKRFNAENDLPTANAIARQLAGGEFDLVLTASTLSLQTMANANQAGRTKHVFGIVADPFGAGVGINRDNPLDHPKHLTGIGSMIPVEKAFELARELYPDLRSVGLAWNAAESNSEAFTKAGRAVCQRLGIRLLEANVENTAGVSEAASSLVARGAQALWISGDVTVLVAAEAVIEAARKGRIPAFSIIPPNVNKGTLFDLGANFYEVGRQTGEIAARVLNGADPAEIPVIDSVPERLAVNRLALAGLKDPWRLPDSVLERAAIVVDADGVRDKSAAAATPQPGRTFKIGVVYFAPEEGTDLVLKGLFDGLREKGFAEGKNVEVRRSHAQGEMANIPALLQNYDNQDVDLIVTLTTPCLTSACTVVKKKPVVFTYVYDPLAAGAGPTRTDHVPHVTGVGSFPPVADTIDLIQRLAPGVKAVGTLYNSSEANSRKVVSVARELFTRRGIRLEEVTVANSSEILQAAQVLTHRGIQAMWITGDNTAIQGFDAIARTAQDARLPLIINDPEFVGKGALACAGLGWYEAGRAAAEPASRILLGESPAKIPIAEVAVKKIVLNHDAARRLGITFPADLLREAGE